MRLIHYCIVLVFLLSLTSCTTTVYYVVRHGEKLNDTDDSPLNDDGVSRAKVLADVLSNKNISRIYVSDKQRTQQTAAPTAARFNLEPIIIPKPDTDLLIQELKDVNRANVLVVRHAEEIHRIVNALSPSDTIGLIPNEYDNLFVITKDVILGQTVTHLTRSRYGDP